MRLGGRDVKLLGRGLGEGSFSRLNALVGHNGIGGRRHGLIGRGWRGWSP